MNERMELLKKLQTLDFLLMDTNSYLDTHPNDQKALSFYCRHLEIQKEIRAEFVKKYGPLTPNDFDCERTWAWVEEPWPWQPQCGCKEGN